MPQSSNAVWDRALTLLRERIPRKTVENWLRTAKFGVSSDESGTYTAEIQVPSSFCRNYLRSNFRRQIEETLEEVLEGSVSLTLLVDKNPTSSNPGDSSESTDSKPSSASCDSPSPGTSSGSSTRPQRGESGRDDSLTRPGSGEETEEDVSQGASTSRNNPDHSGPTRTDGGSAPPSRPREVKDTPSSEDVSAVQSSSKTPSESTGTAPQSVASSPPSARRRERRPQAAPVEESPANDSSTHSGGRQNLRSGFTFEEFIQGESNRLAYSSSFSVAKRPGKTDYNPLVLFGKVGLGKTHLAQAIANYSVGRDTTGTVCYLSSERFTSQFVSAIREDRFNAFSAFYRSVDLLVVDDIQFLEEKEKTQEEFFHLFNDLHQSGKQIVLCADRPPGRIAGIEDRLLSRFQWGLTAEIQRPSFEMRIKLLERKASNIGLELDSSVLEIVADSLTENVRQLEGAVKQLSAHAKLRGETLDIADVKQILGDEVGVQAERRRPQLKEIIEVVASHYSLSPDDLISRGRQKTISNARQVAMYFGRDMTSLSYASIGRRFGGRDHSTVIHACKKVQDQIDVHDEYEEEIESIQSEIRRTIHA